MTNSIKEYLAALKSELKGSDPATIQDAMMDAEEHLTTAFKSLRENKPKLDEAAALPQIIDQYGTPEETAAAYMEIERRTNPGPGLAATKKRGSVLGRFFGIYTDTKAWGALLYMLIAFVTGIVYFSWAVTGLAVSISFSIFIFGLPVLLLFLLSVRGVAWLEGRLVEALLGVRMPRRQVYAPQNIKWQERIKILVTDKHTWFSILYMILQLVLGVVYFVILIITFAFSLTGLAIPILQLVFELPMIIYDGSVDYFLPNWGYPMVVIAGILLWTFTMHLAKKVGDLHGRYAKALLVSD